jgi:hypothetical protein
LVILFAISVLSGYIEVMSKDTDDEYEADYKRLIEPPEQEPHKPFAAFDVFDLIAAGLIFWAVWYFDYFEWATNIVTPIVQPLIAKLFQLLGLG